MIPFCSHPCTITVSTSLREWCARSVYGFCYISNIRFDSFFTLLVIRNVVPTINLICEEVCASLGIWMSVIGALASGYLVTLETDERQPHEHQLLPKIKVLIRTF